MPKPSEAQQAALAILKEHPQGISTTDFARVRYGTTGKNRVLSAGAYLRWLSNQGLVSGARADGRTYWFLVKRLDPVAESE